MLLLKEKLKFQPTKQTYPKTPLSPQFKGVDLNKYKAHTAQLAESILETAISNGMINPNKINRICDFGAGYGGPTNVLKKRFPHTILMALEQNKDKAKHLLNSELLPYEAIIIGDGVKQLTTMAKEENSKLKYDLITAFLFGPDKDGELTRKLLKPATESLSENGKLLICSDLWTMSKVSWALTHNGYRFQRMSLPLEWQFDCKKISPKKAPLPPAWPLPLLKAMSEDIRFGKTWLSKSLFPLAKFVIQQNY